MSRLFELIDKPDDISNHFCGDENIESDIDIRFRIAQLYD